MNRPWRNKKLSVDAAWSLAGNGCAVLAGLATVKMVSLWVDPGAYGHASLVLGVIAALSGAIIGPLMVAHLRLYFDYRQRGEGDWYVKTYRLLALAMGSLAAGIYVAIALWRDRRGEHLFLSHVLPVLLLLVVQPMISLRTNYLEANRWQRQLAIFNVTNRSFQPLVLWLLLYLRIPAVDSLLLAPGLAGATIALFYSRKEPGHDQTTDAGQARPRLNTLLWELAQFGWSLPLTFGVMWVLTTSDRYFIEYFRTPADVGRYAINYGLWSIPFTFLNGWLEILTRPMIYKAAASGEHGRVVKLIALRLGVGAALSVAGGLLLVLLAPAIASAVLGTAYWIDLRFVGLICGAHVFYVMGYSVVPVFVSAKKTNGLFLAGAGAALVNIGANWVLVQRQGVHGAALATLIAYAVWLVLLIPLARIAMRNDAKSAVVV